MTAKETKLTDKEEMFCQEYLIDLNATKAAIRAGYSEASARQLASRSLSKAYIIERIAELQEERSSALKINAKWVLKQLVDIHELDVKDILDNTGNFKSIIEWPKPWRQYLSGFDIQEINSNDVETVVRKIKWPDKVKNLEMIGKHVDIQAFKDKGSYSPEAGSSDQELSTEKTMDLLTKQFHEGKLTIQEYEKLISIQGTRARIDENTELKKRIEFLESQSGVK
tara:strand:+ start:1725 stop:2399 length:675 start_codon:yes stop_codon:yes gene_type:complete